jgi:deoxycytidylate deaminase
LSRTDLDTRLTAEVKTARLGGVGDLEPLDELVFAFTRAQGTDLVPIRELLDDFLAAARFHYEDIPIQVLLYERVFGGEFRDAPVPYREKAAIALGDRFRKICDSLAPLAGVDMKATEAAALVALQEIDARRGDASEAARAANKRGIAWVIRHLVHEDEVTLLHRIYGPRFILIAVFESRDDRLAALKKKYTPSGQAHAQADAQAQAEDIIAIDAGLKPSCDEVADPRDQRYRQDIQKAYPLADLFLNVVRQPVTVDGREEITSRLDDRSTAKLAQLIAQIVGYPFSTPDKHEAGMAYAYQARVSSASLGRQVGASILSGRGDLLTTGWNDVPAPGGGVYVQHHTNLEFLESFGLPRPESRMRDFRDHVGHTSGTAFAESNSKIRHGILSELLERLDELNVLDTDALDELTREQLGAHLGDVSASEWAAALALHSRVKSAAFSGILEYGRSVHAEMNAITTAAREGISLEGASLYTTTFPCHECARHIIATGIKEVIYIEPFPKSRVFELHGDAVVGSKDALQAPEPATQAPAESAVVFLPFIGISPWRHEELFAMVHRKRIDQPEEARARHVRAEDLWALADWDVATGRLRPAFRARLHEIASRAEHESYYVEPVREVLEEALDRISAEVPET